MMGRLVGAGVPVVVPHEDSSPLSLSLHILYIYVSHECNNITYIIIMLFRKVSPI